jgi:hypothetical protein
MLLSIKHHKKKALLLDNDNFTAEKKKVPFP